VLDKELLSFTPGFSRVAGKATSLGNRFNGFLKRPKPLNRLMDQNGHSFPPS